MSTSSARWDPLPCHTSVPWAREVWTRVSMCVCAQPLAYMLRGSLAVILALRSGYHQYLPIVYTPERPVLSPQPFVHMEHQRFHTGWFCLQVPASGKTRHRRDFVSSFFPFILLPFLLLLFLLPPFFSLLSLPPSSPPLSLPPSLFL